MKLWRAKNNVPFKKSLGLELITIDACKGLQSGEIERQLINSLIYLRDKIMDVRIIDPANTNNFISEELSYTDRFSIKAQADAAVKAQYWSQVLA